MLFIAKKRGLRLIKRPTDIITDENRRTQVIRGEKVEFVNGRYQTTNQDLIDWMIGNKDKGIPPHEEFKRGGFAAVPEKEIAQLRTQTVQMITGATATGSRLGVGTPNPEPVIVVPQASQMAAVADLLAESEKRTDEKISAALGQIMALLKGTPMPDTKLVEPVNVAPPPLVKTKKVFKCPVPGCGKIFLTGFAVGTHKKEDHPEVYISKGE